MNSKCISLFLFSNFISFSLNSMHCQKTLEEFKLTRPYGGALKSNFDDLPQDLFETHIKNHLIETLIKKFKSQLLLFKNETKKHALAQLNVLHNSIFMYHDGTYTTVPLINQTYTMWDELKTIEANNKIITPKKKGLSTQSLLLGLCYTKKEEKPPLKLWFSTTEYISNSKYSFDIEISSYISSTRLDNSIEHYLFDCNQELLVIGTSGYYNNLFMYDVLNKKILKFSFNGSITTLCAAHKVPYFFVGSKNGDAYLILKRYCVNIKAPDKETIVGAEFSPDDNKIFCYSNKTFIFYNFQNIQKKPLDYHYQVYPLNSPIKKALFSPDGSRIITALANGDLILRNGSTGEGIRQYKKKWCFSDAVDINNQPPLFLISSKNNILFSLDLNKWTNNTSNVTIRKLSNGKILFLGHVGFKNVRAIGLTKDENDIICTDKKHETVLLNLYNQQDIKIIDFIEKKANIVQLCELYQIYKTCKPSEMNKAFETSKFITTFVQIVLFYSPIS